MKHSVFSIVATLLLAIPLTGVAIDTQPHSIEKEIETQGDTSTASVVKLTLVDSSGNRVFKDGHVRVRVCNDGTWNDSTNATIAGSEGTTARETITSNKDIVFESPTGTAATATLTISGTVDDAETVTIDDRVYEFDGHDPAQITTGNVRVNVVDDMTSSQGTLTVAAQVTAADTMTVGNTTYTFVTPGNFDAAGEISIGTDLATGQAAIVSALNGTDGVNSANAQVSAADFSANDSVLTSKIPGASGDTVVTTETFTDAGNVFDAATLGTTTAGADAAAADAVTALVSAIDGDGDAEVDAADGAGDTVDITADDEGSGPNSFATTETMANGSWGSSTMSGGVDDDPGAFYISVTDGTAETVTIRSGNPPIGGFIMDHSDFLDVTHAAP